MSIVARLEAPRPQKILIVDDHPFNLELLEQYLRPEGYVLVRARDGVEAIEKFVAEEPDLIVMDVMMPRLNGYQVTEQLKALEEASWVPIVLVTAMSDPEDRIRATDAGADGFLSKPYHQGELLSKVRSLLKLKARFDAKDTQESVIFSLAAAVEAKHVYTRGHSERVAHYAVRLARALDFGQADRLNLRYAGLLHDIGKIGMADAILDKPGPLTDVEYAIVRSHSVIGARICTPLRAAAAITPMIRHHHERFDGCGHPDNLAGRDIPVGARIIAICDSWDAMTSTRAYRKAMPREDAAAVMRRERSSGQWDEELLAVFLELVDRGDI
ncbi:MAG TPA: HD domain-containing phosphohydrolase [Thermodesulfobacteriota bacterium]